MPRKPAVARPIKYQRTLPCGGTKEIPRFFSVAAAKKMAMAFRQKTFSVEGKSPESFTKAVIPAKKKPANMIYKIPIYFCFPWFTFCMIFSSFFMGDIIALLRPCTIV